MIWFGAALLTFLVGMVAVYICHPLAQWLNIVDSPDKVRKFHKNPTPTTGGIGIAIAFYTGMLTLNYFAGDFITGSMADFMVYLVVGSVVIVTTGFLDDLHGFSSRPKFILQILAATIIVFGLDQTFIENHASYGNLGFVGKFGLYALITLWLVSNCNSINLIDGVDALAASVSLTIGLGLTVVGFIWGNSDVLLLMIPLLGAIGAFLMYNRPPASIFMGDTGSLLIGFVLSTGSVVLSLNAPKWIFTFGIVAMFALPLLDTILSIIRRVKENQNPFESDSNHVHHVIQRYYKSPYMSIGIMTTFSALMVLMGVLLSNISNEMLFFSSIAIMGLLFAGLIALYVVGLNKSNSVLGSHLMYQDPLSTNLKELSNPEMEFDQIGHKSEGTEEFAPGEKEEVASFID